MKQQNKKINLEFSIKEIGWLIEALEYYLEEAEASENEAYFYEIDTILGRLLKE